jgi:hypothetical protein
LKTEKERLPFMNLRAFEPLNRQSFFIFISRIRAVSLSLNFDFMIYIYNVMFGKRRIYAGWFVMLLLFWTGGCHKDDDDSSASSETTLKMKNANNGQTYLGGTSIYIDNDNYFAGGQFVDLGKMTGLDDISDIPDAEWSLTVAVTPGNGYVARYGTDYYGIYVVAYIMDTDEESVIVGAEVFYELKDSQPVPSLQTSPPYAVGSIYSVDGVRGVVYKISDNGTHGMILSLYETQCTWATVNDELGCSDEDDGMNNMDLVKQHSGWPNRFPAFKWCDDLNTDGVSGWYLPARHEITELHTAAQACRDQMEESLLYHGGDAIGEGIYWSSCEYSNYSAWSHVSDTGHQTNSLKSRSYSVRAVKAF